jgi:hypothetical protein
MYVADEIILKISRLTRKINEIQFSYTIKHEIKNEVFIVQTSVSEVYNE